MKNVQLTREQIGLILTTLDNSLTDIDVFSVDTDQLHDNIVEICAILAVALNA
jgi:hypothetical protein